MRGRREVEFLRLASIVRIMAGLILSRIRYPEEGKISMASALDYRGAVLARITGPKP